MAATRGRRVALGAGAAWLVLLTVTGWALKDRLWEEWWLYSLEQGDEEQQRVAAEKLGEMQSVKALPALVALLRAGPLPTRMAAVIALGKIGRPARAALPALDQMGGRYRSTGGVFRGLARSPPAGPRPRALSIGPPTAFDLSEVARELEAERALGIAAAEAMEKIEAADADAPR